VPNLTAEPNTASLPARARGRSGDRGRAPRRLAVRFPARPYVFLRLAEWMELERACCPFLDFGLIFENSVPTTRLDVRGPEGVKEFLRAELPFAGVSAVR
jgi:hypothetical protein